MKLENAVVFATGANRGRGPAFEEAALDVTAPTQVAASFEVLANNVSRQVKQSLSTPAPAYAG